MEKIKVDLGERSYYINIGKNIIDETGLFLEELRTDKNCLIISNDTVFSLYGQRLVDSLEKYNYKHQVFLAPDGENAKALNIAAQIYDAALEAKLNRNSLVIALGGGVVGDLAGFIAATYMRGTNFVQIPTTLLAQVDSSVGGKVAINHPAAKNIIGAFYQPKMVIADSEVLKTLPAREISTGMAEVIKYGIIYDYNFFEFLEKNHQAILNLESAEILKIILNSCCIKAEIVKQDERELGLRAILNLGHTIGHALESITKYEDYKHGEAVALGIAVVSKFAQQMSLIDEATVQRIKNILVMYNLPVELPQNLNLEEVVDIMLLDKKNSSALITMIIPTEIGSVKIQKFPSEEILDLFRLTN